MSLSFVSKSVQTTTEDGGFVEEAIAGASTENESTGMHKPLFEQLRANQEQAEAEQEEYQRALMRGTLALDEEDAAHLESLRRKEREQQDEVKRRTEEELAAFRAARADRSETELQQPEETTMNTSNQTLETEKVPAKPKLAAPQIIIKRKRRKDAGQEDAASEKKPKSSNEKEETATEKNQSTEQPKVTATQPGLGSLLGGYGSSSDED
uniref:FAM192A/Fyv6 N-terminal domain-containing protein n=1 Tax=Amphora coffeiformis TaxID=265554 RepID=A0A7S3L488_9STRA|mmetsp:Transcript_11655/g.22341  ORF Transcript_11655/g.22341 Transcript_11655/m.22341 type:complete len:210 (-) Transcript_11655:13-642(-)|eukprot:scaffold804_cov165-Amphora_coffeaeformis.AAC.23